MEFARDWLNSDLVALAQVVFIVAGAIYFCLRVWQMVTTPRKNGLSVKVMNWPKEPNA